MRGKNIMKEYSISYTFCDGNYNIEINTNYIIKAENKEIAMKKALEIKEEISKYINVFYYTGNRDIIINVIQNPYFNKAIATKYIFYNKAKTKKEFIDKLEDDYDGYFSQKHSKLIFECTSFEISNCE